MKLMELNDMLFEEKSPLGYKLRNRQGIASKQDTRKNQTEYHIQGP